MGITVFTIFVLALVVWGDGGEQIPALKMEQLFGSRKSSGAAGVVDHVHMCI